MIDNLAVFLSCAGVAIVVWRAIRLDARLPWFTRIGEKRNPAVPDRSGRARRD